MKYKWQQYEKKKLVNRFLKYGWKIDKFKDFGCTWEGCRNELKRLGYIE